MTALPAPSLSLLEAKLRTQVWRGDDSAAATNESISSGFAALDAVLPGHGWPTHCLSELLLPYPGIGEIRLLTPALKVVTQTHRPILLLAPPYVPHWNGWTFHHIDPQRLLQINPGNPADLLWAIEQSVCSGAYGAVLAWLPEQTSVKALRRLQLGAAKADGLTFLFRDQTAQVQPSPAPLRITLEVGDDRRLRVQIVKRRGAVIAKPIDLVLPAIRPLRPVRRHMENITLNRKPVHALDRLLLPHSAS